MGDHFLILLDAGLCYPETLPMASTMVRLVSFIEECAKMRVKLKVPIVKNLHSD